MTVEHMSVPPAYPTIAQAARLWARIGVLSFGGPVGQIALMHRELVDERRWISESRFLHALNFCMLLPGPEAQQLATYIGWLLHGWRGGVIAGTLFILPGLLIILGLSSAYALWGETHLLSGVFDGLKAAVLAIVVEAVIRVGRRSLRNVPMQGLASAAFLALFVFAAPFPFVVLAAGLIGYLGFQLAPSLFSSGGHQSGASDLPAVIGADAKGRDATVSGSLRAVLIWISLWAAPFALMAALGQQQSVFWEIATFFSKMAVVTFGGAYAVLSYVAQQAVEQYHWLKPGEMLDGLGLAETTPGPLVLVLSFVGFIAGFRQPFGLGSLAGGATGALLAAWVTFVPCFLWIFLCAPWIERLRANEALSGALAAISAAVTGVILNLAVWFGVHVLFQRSVMIEAGPVHMSLPELASVSYSQLVLTAIAALMLFRFKLGALKVLGAAAALGMAWRLLA